MVKPATWRLNMTSPLIKTCALAAMAAAWCVVSAVSALAQTRAPSTEEFVKKAAISDMMQIQSSQLALSRQPDADTKPFAERMVKDHQQTSTELKNLVNSGKVPGPLPTSLDADHQKQFDELKFKSGKDFDRAYDQMQLQAHEEAVALFEQYSQAGENPDLKEWAVQTLPHLKEHLAMAKELS
jgi:putative membrane protein